MTAKHSTIRFGLLLALLCTLLTSINSNPPTALAQSPYCAGTTPYGYFMAGTMQDDWITCDSFNNPGNFAEVLAQLGNDEIWIDSGITVARISGDSAVDVYGQPYLYPGSGGNDHIVVDGIVTYEITGDQVLDFGGLDRIEIYGQTSVVIGDNANLGGGDDIIEIYGNADVIVGDESGGNGGQDTITIHGYVSDSVIGDASTDYGGNDTIIIESNGQVQLAVQGDGAHGHTTQYGGNDIINVYGYTTFIYGDNVHWDGGDDEIIVYGTVYNIYGDSANRGGNDVIEVYGTVQEDIYGDATLNDDGDDIIILAGSVRNIYADDVSESEISGNDIVELRDGAQVNGFIDGGRQSAGMCDTLIFSFTGIAPHEQQQIDDYASNPRDGSITVNGQTYTWQNFECIQNNSR